MAGSLAGNNVTVTGGAVYQPEGDLWIHRGLGTSKQNHTKIFDVQLRSGVLSVLVC